MTFIQRFLENVIVGISIFLLFTIPMHHFNPFIHMQSNNYKTSIMSFALLKKHLNYNTYNTSQQCIQSPISSIEQTKYISFIK